ncbi:MAG: hypothetical protein RIC89_15075 [Pseudomonadales bacterium]
MGYTENDRKDLYARARDELISGQRLNTDAYDRSILTLSAAFLAFSISFIKDIAPLPTVSSLYLLDISWFLFGLTIIFSLSGMLLGNWIYKRLLASAAGYYLDGKEEAYSQGEKLQPVLDIANIIVGLIFFSAVACTITFAVFNYQTDSMTDKKQTTSIPKKLEKSQPVNNLPRVPPQQPAPSNTPKPHDSNPAPKAPHND